MNKIKIISVDFQKDFTEKEGFAYKPRVSVDFVKNTFVPFIRKNKIKIAEIISDYREIPLSPRGFFCQPGTVGYESEIPNEVKIKDVWIKCQHSPVWIRKNIGIEKRKLGTPYADPKKFEKWLDKNIGNPKKIDFVVLIGLTINCCLLSVAQELFFRGYKVKILKEATDDFGGSIQDKENAFKILKGNRWADPISWNELKKEIENKGL